MVVGGNPLYGLPEFWVNGLPLDQNRRFLTDNCSAHSASAITPSEKVQLTLIGSRTQAFNWYRPR